MDSAFLQFFEYEFRTRKKILQRNFNPPGVVWFLDFKPKKVHNSKIAFFCSVFLIATRINPTGKD